MGDFYLRRGESGDAGRALATYKKSLGTRQRSYQQNPNDAQAARDLVVSYYSLAKATGEAGNEAAAQAHWQSCCQVLRRMVADGLVLDEPLRQLLEQLEQAGMGG